MSFSTPSLFSSLESPPLSRLPAQARFVPPPAIWRAKAKVEENDRLIASSLGISPIAAAILRSRGHQSEVALKAFLEPGPELLNDPAGLPDIEKAVARLQKAIKNGERVLVFGDYDVDGVTSTALVVRTLQKLGVSVGWRVPERDEGYGIRIENIDEAATQGYDLILTVDCGITAIEPARRAREIGLDLLITDHHECSGEIPDALAVVNPKRPDSAYPFTGLSGCGVAFKVMQELLRVHRPGALRSFEDKYLDLVALSTIADCVPLHDENRYLTFAGLNQLYNTRRKGLRALIESASLSKRDVFSGGDIGFRLAPRINAAGRLESPTLALRLLLSDDDAECLELAAQIEEINSRRKGATEGAVTQAEQFIDANANLADDRLLIAVGEGWQRGVVGLIAAKLVDRYCRPAFALNAHNGEAHGSGRSCADFDLHELLEASRDLLIGGGGHAAACGVTLETAKVPQFRERALEYAASKLSAEDLVPRKEADCEIEGRDLNLQLGQDLLRFEPCGTANCEPVLLVKGARWDTFWPIKNEHFKGKLNVEGRKVDWIWWRCAERISEFSIGDRADLLVAPQINEYRGDVTLQLVVKDARRAK